MLIKKSSIQILLTVFMFGSLLLAIPQALNADDTEVLPGPDEFVVCEIMPEMIYTETPVYPKELKKKGTEGVVWVKALVDKNGSVVNSMIGKPSGLELLDKSALEASLKCKFKPAIQNGRPVAVWVTYKVSFTLADKLMLTDKDTLDQLPVSEDFTPLEVIPELLTSVEPDYPAKAKKEGIEAELWIKVLVDKEGNVIDAEIAKTNQFEYGFNIAAIEAAFKSKYKPGIQNGKPVNAWITYKVVFTLD